MRTADKRLKEIRDMKREGLSAGAAQRADRQAREIMSDINRWYIGLVR
jgi:hypothetical protein